MYTSNVIAAHILCLLSNSAIITSSKNEKRDVKEVTKINKNLHAIGLCDRAGIVVLWKQKADTACYSSCGR